ncbi:hypothetical protein GMD78_18010 [Ornithinibacillus sp. L9]|uniref:Uncharacterized protein n=1 Tax=Ornithinibacillus caprae TaxID=2678566 RepID=A0A6N8FKU2_9BACI|nr:hypothetical protein [Ornithinibacillus caprae]MUK90272.1 hypothetical protein [Ornithinibacillus caprae]
MGKLSSKTDEFNKNQRKRIKNVSKGWISAVILISVLILFSMFYDSEKLTDNIAEEDILLLPKGDEEVLQIEIGLVGIHAEKYDPWFSEDINEEDVTEEEIQPIYLRYELGLTNLWDDPLGSIKGFDPKDKIYENGVKVHLEPQETMKDVMDEMFRYNLFTETSGYQGNPVISTIRGGWYTLAYELNTEKQEISEEDKDRLLSHSTDVDVVVTLKNKEIGRFYLKDEMHQVNKE